MSVNDLTNTTWLFNDVISYMSSSWSIDFISNNTNYTIIRNRYDMYIAYDSTNAYDFDQNIWVDNAYKTIAITGGSDVTNSSLISWLESNATMQESSSDEGDSSNHTHFGSTNIIKKQFGNLEIIKEVLNGTTIYEKSGSSTPSGYSGNILSSYMDTPDRSGYTYFKLDSDTCDENNYDGYVDRYGDLTGVSSFSNITKIALYCDVYQGTIAYINGNYIDTNGGLQVVNLTADGDITIYGLKVNMG